MHYQSQPANAEVSARTALTKQVSNYSHKVWWRRAQDAKEIAYAIQEQVKSLNDSCATAVDTQRDEQKASQALTLPEPSYGDLSVQVSDLQVLLRHVPLTASDQSFVMARLKSTCTHLRQIELRAGIHGRLERQHSDHWQAMVEATQKIRLSLYSVIGHPLKAH
jgi:hypothetical protein